MNGIKNVHVTMGSNKYSTHEREEHDFYTTDPKALEVFPSLNELVDVWECAVGFGHLAKVLQKNKKLARVSDLIDRGYPNTEVLNFLEYNGKWHGDILTNPPFKLSNQFLEKAMAIAQDGRKVCMFLPIRYLEGKARRKLFDKYPPKIIYVSSGRLGCAKNGDFSNHYPRALAFGWFVWEKGYKGRTTLTWFN